MTESKQYIWESIEIKPNDQSLVGEVVRLEDWDPEHEHFIEDVGTKFVYLKYPPDFFPRAREILKAWLIRREVKKKEMKVCSDITYVSKEIHAVRDKLLELKIILDDYKPDGTFDEPDDG